jgi:microsomal dipeptidase-like Zn-dependent dipeptidase
MKRRDFLSASAALAAGVLAPRVARSQQRVARFCELLAQRGLANEHIHPVPGGNYVRVLSQSLRPA